MENSDQKQLNYSTSQGESTLNENTHGVDEISLKELILKIGDWYKYLVSKWVTILLIGTLGALFGFTYAWHKAPVYTAITTFVLESGDSGGSGLSQYSGIASMVGIDIGGGGGGIFQGDNIIALYKSRTMIEKTLLTEVDFHGKKKLLIEHYIDFNNLRENWSKIPQLSNFKFNTQTSSVDRIQDSILGEGVKDINKNYLVVSKPDKKLSIIKVETHALDEFFAKTFNNQIVKNVNDFYVETKTKKSLENVAILQQKTDSVRRIMNGAIYTAASVSDATPNLNPTRQIQRLAPIQRSQFSAETNKAILSELVKNLEMAKISLRKETPLIQVVDEPVFPLEREKISKLKGIVYGGLLGGFLIILILVIKRAIKLLLS